MVSSVARRLGFSDQQCSQIALALDEALCNVMRHGYGRRLDGPIWVSVWPLVNGACSCAEPATLVNGTGPELVDGLKLVIEDEAQQVDPAAIKSRDLDDIRPGGLGVHIIKEVMDQVVYEKRADGDASAGVGMRLTMVKKKVGKPVTGASGQSGCGSCCP